MDLVRLDGSVGSREEVLLFLEDVDEKKGNNPRNDGIWKKVTMCWVEVCEVCPEVRSAWASTLWFTEDETEYMSDRTAEVAQFIQESYPAFELVLIRLSNAFDKR